MSLLTVNQSVNWNLSADDNIKRVVARPFCGSHEKMFQYFGVGFHLDLSAARRWLEGEDASREKDVLLYQLQRYPALEKGE